MKTKGEAAQTALNAILSYDNQSRAFESEANAAAQLRAKLKQEFIDALKRLAEVLLPDASPEKVNELAALLNKPELNQQRQRWAGQLPALQSRLQEHAQDPDFADRANLLDPQQGLMASSDDARVRRFVKEAQARVNQFNNEEFQWVLQREQQKAEGVTALQSFLQAVTFVDTKVSRTKEKLVRQYEASDWNSLLKAYHDSLSHLAEMKNLLTQYPARRAKLQRLVKEYHELSPWVHNFEGKLTEELRAVLREALANADFLALMKGPREQRLLAGKLHSLAARGRYLGQLESYLRSEAADRKRRLNSISRVRLLWERRPWEPLESDKTKWLVTVPELKQKSSEKRVRWGKRMRECFDDFDDDEGYAYYYESHQGQESSLLPYDIFAYLYSEPMPYEGFAAEVIPDIAAHRQAHQLEKADYSGFRSLDTDRAADLREETPPDAPFEEAALAAAMLQEAAIELADLS